jgi:fucose permease
LFYILFTASRLFSGIAIEKVGYLRSIYIAAGGVIAVYAVGFALGRGGIWVLPVSGLFIAVMWPTMMAIAMKAFGSDAPNATSAIITISGAINGVVQMGIGLTNRYAGAAWGYRSCLVYAVILLVMVVVLAWKLKNKPYLPVQA